MGFNEQQFRTLVDETLNKVIALGTTSKNILTKHQKSADKLVEYLKARNVTFERGSCLEWVDSMKPFPLSASSAAYVEWIAFRRFVNLLAEQEAGTLNSWKPYRSKQREMPRSDVFLNIYQIYQRYLSESGICGQSVYNYMIYIRWFLLYFEKQGITDISDIENKDIAGYFLTPRFKNRFPRGMKLEINTLKKFILFLIENGYNSRKTLCYAIPQYRVSTEKIITTLDPEMIADIMEDDPGSIINKRDKAFCLLALNIGLRSSDIRSLKFCDIDWEQGTLSIRQQKTNVALQMPLDNETQNAIIDYILHERRDLKSDYVFITAVGGARKITAWHYRIKRRAKNTVSFNKIPHDGLHILRRTFASNLLKCGTPLATISEMMGHIDKNIVQRYLSTDDEKMKRCSLDLSLIPCRKEQF